MTIKLGQVLAPKSERNRKGNAMYDPTNTSKWVPSNPKARSYDPNEQTSVDLAAVSQKETVDCWDTVTPAKKGSVHVLVLTVQNREAPVQRLSRGQRIAIGRFDSAEAESSTDEWMSRNHFTIECLTTHGLLQDMDSKNGTQLNGMRVKRAHLNDGDVITAGRTVFTVQLRAG